MVPGRVVTIALWWRSRMRPFKVVGHYGSLIKLSHTIFALPFAFSAIVWAQRYASLTIKKAAWILVCLVSARTAAMAFNRFLDHQIDAANPRTSMRELPTGMLTPGQVRTLVLVSSVVFVMAATALGPLPMILSPLVLWVVLGYSWTKRFTSWCHIVLGVAIALAPGGAWIAMGAPITPSIVALVLGVSTWVAGFDVLYALQDERFDRAHALHSIPVALGRGGALVVSALMHVGTVACFVLAGVTYGAGLWYFAGVAITALILIYEHSIVKVDDLSRINRAFFDLNGYVSIVFFVCTLLDKIRG